MKVLHLTLKKKFFDMIASSEKKEEYREVKPYWIKRLLDSDVSPKLFNEFMPYDGSNYYTYLEFWQKAFTHVVFKNGYAKNAPTITVNCGLIEYGKAKPEWSDNWQGEVFIIKLGEIISKQ